MGSLGVEEPSVILPIIDLISFTKDSPLEERIAIGKKLVNACQQVGFVYIQNYGLPQDQLSKAFEVSRKFYEMSPEKKDLAPHPPGWAVHRGYSKIGLERVANVASEEDNPELTKQIRQVEDCKESYEIGSENNKDQPNVWLPSGVYDEFQTFMTDFYWTCFEPKKLVLRALALGLGLEENTFVNFHTGDQNQLRLAHYPPIPAAEIESGKYTRIAAHEDWSTVTILFQDDCGGLQIENPNEKGRFLHVPPIPGTLVMNIGDMMMRWSNGILKSTSHRVTLPPLEDRYTGEERMTRERYSIVYFSTTKYDQIIEPLVTDANNPPKYEPVTWTEYAASKARMTYES